MIRTELLENKPDLEALLEPKKKIHNLIIECDGSMLKFHKAVKSSKELEELAETFFASKENFKTIKNKSTVIPIDRLTNRLAKLKGMRAAEVDFV